MAEASSWREYCVDGGVVHFHRDSLINVLRRGPSTQHVRRVAPRTLQVGLLTPCNLACAFCYRDQSAPSRLTAPFLVDLLEKACDWGVLEVAFGGGEPLLFKGFVEMLRELRAKTSLGVAFTTNGTLLNEQVIRAVRDLVTEIRVSAYADNGYRKTLRRLNGMQAGINWLVTPNNVGLVEPYVVDFLKQGAKNVLLLGYKGDDLSLHLSERDFDVLRRALHRLEGAPIRLDVCWHPHLRDVPQLFERGDCRAGDEFLVITPDRAVQACSFSRKRQPFESFEELRRIYEQLRVWKPEADVLGCTRSAFVALAEQSPEHESAWLWRAAASNNSGDWTIAARFCDADTAARVAESLRELARAHEAFLASPEGQQWIEEKGFDGSNPTPSLIRFGEEHGFDWTTHGDGLWWEEDGCGAPVLTAGAIGDAVIVYHRYCMGLPEAPFRAFFERVGAIEFGYWQYHRPQILASARGRNELAERKLADYLLLIRAAKYSSDVKEPPPWGETCEDSRVQDDEDRSARIASAEPGIERQGDRLRIALSFENSFAGAVALANWLSANGYVDVEVSMGPVLSACDAGQNEAPIVAKTGLFGDVRPIGERLKEATPAVIVGMVFAAGGLSEHLKAALDSIPSDRVAELALGEAWSYWSRALDVTRVSVQLLEHLPTSPAAQVFARELWSHLRAQSSASCGLAVRALTALPRDEALALASDWCTEPAIHLERGERLLSLFVLRNAGCVALYEAWWRSHPKRPPVTDQWTSAIAKSGLPWDIALRWIGLGRPLSLLAIGVLAEYASGSVPDCFQPPEAAELERVLRDYVRLDSVPRVRNSVDYILSNAGTLSRA